MLGLLLSPAIAALAMALSSMSVIGHALRLPHRDDLESALRLQLAHFPAAGLSERRGGIHRCMHKAGRNPLQPSVVLVPCQNRLSSKCW